MNEYGIIANVCPNTRNAEHKENYFFEEELYKELFVIERTNAWMDGWLSLLLTRFDTTISNWKGWSYLVFTVIWLNETHKSQNLNEFNVFSRHEHVHASNDWS